MGCLVSDRVIHILSGPRVILFLSGPSHLRARFVLLPCYTPVRLNDVRLKHESARGAELYRVRRKRFMQLLFCSFMTFEKYSRRRFGNTHTAVQDTRMHTAHEATPHTTTNTPRSHCGVVAHSTNYTNSTQRSRLIRGQGSPAPSLHLPQLAVGSRVWRRRTRSPPRGSRASC